MEHFVCLFSGVLESGTPHYSPLYYRHYLAVFKVVFCIVHQAFVELDREGNCFENLVFSIDNGLKLLDYTDGCLTFEREINKLATNVALGR